MISILLLALKAATISAVWTQILIQPGHFFHPFWTWIERIFTIEKITLIADDPPVEVKNHPDYKFEVIRKIEKKRLEWILKPLGGCELCNAGQIALWAAIAKIFLPKIDKSIFVYTAGAFNVLFLISAAILFVSFIKFAFHKFKE